MKKLFNQLIILGAIVLLFVQCDTGNDDGDDRPVYIGIGTYMVSDDNDFNFVIDLDNGDQLIPNSVYWVSDGVENESRVTVIYAETAVEESAEGKTITVDIDRIEDVLTKEVIQLTPGNIDSIGNNAVGISEDDVWHSKKHLNVFFYYYGGYYTHFINLVQPIDNKIDSEGNLVLEFKHNANYDPGYALLQGVVSFDMESLRPTDSDSLPYVFTWNGYSGDDNSIKGVFVYGEEEMPQIPMTLSNKNEIIIE